MEINCGFLSCYFTQLDIMEPKVPDDIYKTHLENNSETFLFSFFYSYFL